MFEQIVRWEHFLESPEQIWKHAHFLNLRTIFEMELLIEIS